MAGTVVAAVTGATAATTTSGTPQAVRRPLAQSRAFVSGEAVVAAETIDGVIASRAMADSWRVEKNIVDDWL